MSYRLTQKGREALSKEGIYISIDKDIFKESVSYYASHRCYKYLNTPLYKRLIEGKSRGSRPFVNATAKNMEKIGCNKSTVALFMMHCGLAPSEDWFEKLEIFNDHGRNQAIDKFIAWLKQEGFIEIAHFRQVKLPNVKSKQDSTKGHLSTYCRKIVDSLNKPELEAVYLASSLGNSHRVDIAISDIFVAPYIKNCRLEAGKNLITFFDEWISESSVGSGRRISAIEALRANSRLIVLGSPGGGKTTLVRYILVQLAKNWSSEPLHKPFEDLLKTLPFVSVPLPIYISLSQFYDWLENRTKQTGLSWWTETSEIIGVRVLEYLREKMIAGIIPSDEWKDIENILFNESAFFVFDGLDEVTASGERRYHVSRIIRAFASNLSNTSHVVVTCREHVYRTSDKWSIILSGSSGAGFRQVTIDELDSAQVQEVIQNWEKIPVEISSQSSNNWAERLRPSEVILFREISGLPLLLTLFILVHRNGRSISEDHADIYSNAVTLLLAVWENTHISTEKQHEIAGERLLESEHYKNRIMALDISTDYLAGALSQLALQILERRTDAESSEIITRDEIVTYLSLNIYVDKATVEKFVEYISKRAGILVAVGDGTYRYLHATIKSYMATTAILDLDDFADRLLAVIDRRRDIGKELLKFAVLTMARHKPNSLFYFTQYCLVHFEISIQNNDKQRTILLASAIKEIGVTMTSDNFPFLSPRYMEIRPHFLEIRDRLSKVLYKIAFEIPDMAPEARVYSASAVSRLGDPRTQLMNSALIQFCFVPKGQFQLGRLQQDSTKEKDDRFGFLFEDIIEVNPDANTFIDYDYWISKFPITLAQYEQYKSSQGILAVDFSRKDMAPTAPVTGVLWGDALHFCAWLTNELRQSSEVHTQDSLLWEGIRNGTLCATLPSEAEWERAARGDKGDRIYPWGNEPDLDRANFKAFDQGQFKGLDTLAVVGCYPKGESPYGLQECSGNVWEWTRSKLRNESGSLIYNYPYQRTDGRESLEIEEDMRRVVRGGSHNADRVSVRCLCRQGELPADTRAANTISFRVAIVPAFVVNS